MSEVRVRVRADQPPGHAIAAFERGYAGGSWPLGTPAEAKTGFLGRILRDGKGPQYRAWLWEQEHYVALGLFTDAGSAIAAMTAQRAKTPRKPYAKPPHKTRLPKP